MTQLFDNDDFVCKFTERRDRTDSINQHVDDPAIFSLLPLVNGLRVLEIGCGLGDLSSRLASEGADVIAVDKSSNMIAAARKRHPGTRAKFIVSDFNDFRFEEAFNLTVSAMVAHFIEDFDGFLACVAGTLVEGGLFVFSQRHPIRTSNPNKASDAEGAGWPVHGYFVEGPRIYKWLNHDALIYHRTISTINKSIKANGFDILEICEPKPLGADVGSERLEECLQVPAVLTFKCVRCH